MLASTNHWLSSEMINGTINDLRLQSDNDRQHNYEFSHFIQPVWASLSLVIIILFTVCGNSLVCIAVIRERHLQNTTNYFLTSLAFTDCLVACLVMPLAVTVELIGHFPFNALACNVWLTFDVCCSTSSIWHMSVMSLDRYLTLRYPLKYGRNKRRSLMAYKIITIWLISFGICLPLFILGLVDPSNVYNEDTRACFPAHRTFKIYGSFVAFFIPLIIMIVTYALTMSALQQAHTTKKKRHSRRQKMHAVINLATIAMRWKRAVNNEPMDEQKSSIPSTKSEQKFPVNNSKSLIVNLQRKRATSLLVNAKTPVANKQFSKGNFISHYRLNETSKPLAPITWYKRRDKQLQTLPERSVEQSSPSSNHHRHLDPDSPQHANAHTKRSYSCTPLLDVQAARKDRRRSSSVHTLIQIRRDSAKISEELANLTAQLSAAMYNNSLNSKRTSLAVRGRSAMINDTTPTINQLIAETDSHKPVSNPSSYLTVHPNVLSPFNSLLNRTRSHSADVRLSSLVDTDEKTMMSNGVVIPNLLVTDDSLPNLPTHVSSNSINSTTLNVSENSGSLTRRLTTPSKFDSTCQRIKDWINVTTSSTELDHHSPVRLRCISATHMTEKTPMLAEQKLHAPNSTLSHLKRFIPRLEQLYGPTSAPNAYTRPQPLLLADDHVPSVNDFATIPRSSVCSITSTMLTARLLQAHRPSTSSSICSTFQQIPRKRPPRLNDGMSQASFQMVSLDTEDSSSGSSSLTHQSANMQAAMTGVNSANDSSPNKKPLTFRNLTKTSASNERKAMRVLLIIFSIFVILWTPFFVINLLSCFIHDIHPIFISIATWLGYCSSGANPIIYTIFSRAFRRAFVNILTCRKVISSHRSQVLTPSCHSMTMSVGRKMSTISRGQTDVR